MHCAAARATSGCQRGESLSDRGSCPSRLHGHDFGRTLEPLGLATAAGRSAATVPNDENAAVSAHPGVRRVPREPTRLASSDPTVDPARGRPPSPTGAALGARRPLGIGNWRAVILPAADSSVFLRACTSDHPP